MKSYIKFYKISFFTAFYNRFLTQASVAALILNVFFLLLHKIQINLLVINVNDPGDLWIKPGDTRHRRHSSNAPLTSVILSDTGMLHE